VAIVCPIVVREALAKRATLEPASGAVVVVLALPNGRLALEALEQLAVHVVRRGSVPREGHDANARLTDREEPEAQIDAGGPRCLEARRERPRDALEGRRDQRRMTVVGHRLDQAPEGRAPDEAAKLDPSADLGRRDASLRSDDVDELDGGQTLACDMDRQHPSPRTPVGGARACGPRQPHPRRTG